MSKRHPNRQAKKRAARAASSPVVIETTGVEVSSTSAPYARPARSHAHHAPTFTNPPPLSYYLPSPVYLPDDRDIRAELEEAARLGTAIGKSVRLVIELVTVLGGPVRRSK